MKRYTVALVSLVALMFTTLAQAGEVYARTIVTLQSGGAGATNVAWTIGKYDRPTLLRISTVGMIPAATTGICYVVYGDDAGSTNVLCTLTNASGTASQFINPTRYLQAGDVVNYGANMGATNGAVRFEYIQRDTRTIN